MGAKSPSALCPLPCSFPRPRPAWRPSSPPLPFPRLLLLQAWPHADRPFLFDIPAASALCEAPEYEAQGVMAALAATQHLTALLSNHIADAVQLGAAGKAHEEAAAVAKRLDAMLRHFTATEAACERARACAVRC